MMKFWSIIVFFQKGFPFSRFLSGCIVLVNRCLFTKVWSETVHKILKDLLMEIFLSIPLMVNLHEFIIT